MISVSVQNLVHFPLEAQVIQCAENASHTIDKKDGGQAKLSARILHPHCAFSRLTILGRYFRNQDLF
jgi:hypothetical protein